MCHLSSSLPSRSNLDQPAHNLTKVREHNIFTCLISKDEKQEDHITQETHLSPVLNEAKCIAEIAFPMVLTALFLYSRSMISMLFLGRLGELSLAGGSLAIGLANITGYSILTGLAIGMEPICGQALGAQRYKLLGLTLQRSVLMLLLTSLPISLLWLNMKTILIFCGQDEGIAAQAQTYIIYSIPDLVAQSFLHPLRIYLRTQSITLPLAWGGALTVILHVPINYLLVSVHGLGIRGVAMGGVCANFNLVLLLIIYIVLFRVHEKTWVGVSLECLRGWKSLVSLAVPSCISVCLEWWWYEIMILLCGLLTDPRATVASMGILIQTTALIYIFPSSLSFGVSTRVGYNLGANQPGRAKLAAIVGLSAGFILGILAFCFNVTVRNVWAHMFTRDAEIVTLTAAVLPIIGLCELGNCPQTAGCGVVRGTARPKMAANVNLGCFYLVGMPVALWLGFFGRFGFKGLWLGLLAAQCSCVVSMLVVISRTNWESEAERARLLTGGGGGYADSHGDSNEKSDSLENC
ncbi:hypothetical protein NMG60_11030405 [Bertholletia excelsa]